MSGNNTQTRERQEQGQAPVQAQNTRLVRMQPSQFGLPAKPLTQAHLINDAMSKAGESGCNLLMAQTFIDRVPDHHIVELKMVLFPSEFTEDQRKAKSNGVWYITDNGLALHGTALEQLAALANISFDPTQSGRVDDGRNNFYWRYRAVATRINFDGQLQVTPKECEIDLRDSSDTIYEFKPGPNGKKERQKWSFERLQKARKYGARLCESGASNRAIRKTLGLKGSYSPAEAKRPFVLLVLVPNYPVGSPESMAYTFQKLGVIDKVYGGGAAVGMAPLAQTPAGLYIPSPQPSEPSISGGFSGMGQITAPSQAQPSFAPAPRADERTIEDLERDFDGDEDGASAAPAHQSSGHSAPASGQGAPVCLECGEEIPERVLEFSRKRFGRDLCYKHQPRG